MSKKVISDVVRDAILLWLDRLETDGVIVAAFGITLGQLAAIKAHRTMGTYAKPADVTPIMATCGHCGGTGQTKTRVGSKGLGGATRVEACPVCVGSGKYQVGSTDGPGLKKSRKPLTDEQRQKRRRAKLDRIFRDAGI